MKTRIGQHRARISLAFCLVVLAPLSLMGSSSDSTALAAADTRPWPRTCPVSNRFGFASPGSTDILDYDVGQLNAGWYHNFSIWDNPPDPANLGYVQTVRLIDQVCSSPPCDSPCGACPGGCWPCPTWDQLKSIARAKPGALWLIGNEPDSPYQDDVMPENYARLYHDLHAFLKAEDPTCQVGIGGVVQATPLRIKYLGMILDAYQQGYHRSMPIDVWNTHNYVLREERYSWGAEIPPGVPDDVGILYDINENDLLDPSPTDPSKIGWKQQLVLLRQFMADRGYRDRPLIISEYGILMPVMYGYTPERVRSFMLATFGWMTMATDPSIGYPADGNRLVQAWAWYSLDEDTFETYPAAFNLFDPETKRITALGEAYGAYTADLVEPAIDVTPLDIRHTWPAPGAGDLVTITVTADITNWGSATASDVLVHFERDGVSAGDLTIAAIAAGEVWPATVVWSDVPVGEHISVSVTVDPDGHLAECSGLNNSRTASILVGSHQFFLPAILRNP